VTGCTVVAIRSPRPDGRTAEPPWPPAAGWAAADTAASITPAIPANAGKDIVMSGLLAAVFLQIELHDAALLSWQSLGCGTQQQARRRGCLERGFK
jgi:hypothetical protein